MEQHIPILPLRTRKQIATVLHLLFLMIALYIRFHKPKHETEMVIKLLTETWTANPADFPERPPKVKPDKKKRKKE